jgi:hypothetical protein
MEVGTILDISHISFLDMIKVLIRQSGAANAKGTLIRNALKTAESFSEVNYDSFEDFLTAIENATSPIVIIEGKASHMGEFVFGLKQCPFGTSIKNYTQVFEKLPEGYARITEEYNKPGPVTAKYRIGEGAGVSPFCAVHQPMRSAAAEKIRIGGRGVQIYQLGCKSGAGKKCFADRWIQEVSVSRAVVDKVLDDHMCCYFVKIAD